MIVAALGLFWLDGVLDNVVVPPALNGLFLGQSHVPRGFLMLLVFVALIWLAMRELHGVFVAKGVECSFVMMSIAATVGLVLIWIMPYWFDAQHALAVYASAVVLVFMATLIHHSWGGRVAGATMAAAAVLLAMVYMGVLPGFYLAARRWHSSWVVLLVILVTKSCDIGAYFTGRAIGKHKLIPWLSPGKTWEGLFGGLLFSSLLATGLVAWANAAGVWHENISTPGGQEVDVNYQIPLWAAAIGGALLGGIGQIGDLTASLFKRDAGVKDSGAAVPGFGGLLDIMDSPILVAPLGYWLMSMASNVHWWR